MEHLGPQVEQLNLEALSLFVIVARLGGLNAAAKDTGVPKATLSRRIRELEAGLGTILMDRSTRGMILTHAGRRLFERSAPLLADLAAAEAEVSARDGQVRGHLRVSVPALLARVGIATFAADFLKRYPSVTLELDIDDRFVDPVRDGYDLVIRANPDPDSELVGKCFLRTRGILAAAPGVAQPAGQDVEIAAVILSANSGQKEWVALQDEQEIRLRPRAVLRCSSMMMVYDAVVAGAGVGILPEWLARHDVEAGRLIAWGYLPERSIGAWVLHPATHLTSPKVRAFVDAIVEFFRRETIF